MNYRLLYLFLVITVIFSCSKNDVTLPPNNPNTNLIDTKFILDSVMRKMEGIYSLSDGNNSLGSEFVCRVSKTKVSFFSNESGIFCILAYGLNTADSSIQFSGFWRYSETSTQNIIDFSISKADGSSDLLVN